MKIGFTSTTFRQIRSLDRIVEIAKKAGAYCIEWGGDIHVKDISAAKSAKEKCDAAGLIISSYGSYYVIGSGEEKKWESICEIAATMNAKTVRVWLGKKGSAETNDEEYKSLVSDAKKICAVAKKYNLIVAPECHPNTYNDSTDAFLKIAGDINEENFRTYFQSLYRDWKYDEDRLDRTCRYIENFHISYSERMRMQAFHKNDKDYVNKILKKIWQLDTDGIVLIEYTYFLLPGCLIKDIKRTKKILGVKE
jgi:3-dehydroshikimate dehydratase